jgi:hypothetical protein
VTPQIDHVGELHARAASAMSLLFDGTTSVPCDIVYCRLYKDEEFENSTAMLSDVKHCTSNFVHCSSLRFYMFSY